MREILLKVKELKEVADKIDPSLPPPRQLYNLWSIFKYEDPVTKSWHLFDETCPDGIVIRVNGVVSKQYIPKPGDVVRIHRLIWDKVSKLFAITHNRNVVHWKSFSYIPEPITEANRPTIKDEDLEIQRTLENYYCSQLVPLYEVGSHLIDQSTCLNFAGKVKGKHTDNFGHLRLSITDGTHDSVVRVFKKEYDKDTSSHFNLVESAIIDDCLMFVGGKYDAKYNLINLSSNHWQGRCIRRVDKLSMLGIKLESSLQRAEEPPTDGFIGQILEQTPVPPRRSPRLRSSISSQEAISSQTSRRNSSRNTSQPIASPTLSSPSRLQNQSQPQSQPPELQTRSQLQPLSQGPLSTLNRPPVNLPQFTRLADIIRTTDGYQFYNIAGQVRGTPNVTAMFSNLVFQISDGTSMNFDCFYTYEVKEPTLGCATILVYSQQKAQDSNVHIKVAEKLQEGDLVFIKNIKASWRDGKLKLEMNPYVAHGKSINVIDKDSEFGIRLLEIVSNPIVEELLDDDQLTSGDDSMISIQ